MPASYAVLEALKFSITLHLLNFVTIQNTHNHDLFITIHAHMQKKKLKNKSLW